MQLIVIKLDQQRVIPHDPNTTQTKKSNSLVIDVQRALFFLLNIQLNHFKCRDIELSAEPEFLKPYINR